MKGYRPIGKLTPSTLVYTVAAVVIALPSIDDDIPAIHKALIEQYPQYAKMGVSVVSQNPTDPLRNQEETITQHALNNPDKTLGVLLTKNRILFQTTKYEGFPDFANEFMRVLKIIQEITGLKHQNGIAFRHIDNIMPLDEKAELKTAINEEFYTPDMSHGIESRFSKREYVYGAEKRNLVCRLYNYDEGNAPSMPQELIANYFGLKMHPKISVQKRPFVLGDFEANNIHEEEPAQKFDISAMSKELDELHQFISIAYRQVVTSQELKARGCKDAG